MRKRINEGAENLDNALDILEALGGNVRDAVVSADDYVQGKISAELRH